MDCSGPDCVVPGLTETVCDDGWDDDCDGPVDCDDPDCDVAAICFDGPDDGGGGGDDPPDECGGECIPGTTRWCDTPIACAWGKQDCAPDGRQDDLSAIWLLKREARLTGSLEHPGIVPVYDVGVLPELGAFYAMLLSFSPRVS